jgi:integrase/recombinase XerD
MATLIRRHYTAIEPKTGRKVRKTARKWYGQYMDAEGVTRRVPLSANRTAAQQMLNAIVRKVEMAKSGIFDPFEEHRKQPLADHLRDWETVLKARGNTDKHVDMKVSRSRKILDACKCKLISDLSASRIEAALADMRQQPRFGTQTSNHYLAAVKQFARWLVKDRRTADNPLAHLGGGNVKLDRRHERRELTDTELAYLFGSTRSARTLCGIDGADREMLYLTSVYTGLRASELASLTPESFALDDSTPTLTVEAGYSKHRREDVVPLHADLVRRLRLWLADKPAGERVWPGNWAVHNRGGEMLQADLETARAAWIAEAADSGERVRWEETNFLSYRDEQGRVADFHSLRHTFITRLVKAGVMPKEAQTLARHSTITLTMDRYAHTGLHDVARAVESLPSLPTIEPDVIKRTLKATGTDGRDAIPCTNLALTPDSERSVLTTDDETTARLPVSAISSQSPVLTAVDSDRAQVISGGGGIRTLERVSSLSVFKTDAIGRSATPPKRRNSCFLSCLCLHSQS